MPVSSFPTNAAFCCSNSRPVLGRHWSPTNLVNRLDCRSSEVGSIPTGAAVAHSLSNHYRTLVLRTTEPGRTEVPVAAGRRGATLFAMEMR